MAVCLINPANHQGHDHHDFLLGVHWPPCGTHCAAAGHICGRYRLDTEENHAQDR